MASSGGNIDSTSPEEQTGGTRGFYMGGATSGGREIQLNL